MLAAISWRISAMADAAGAAGAVADAASLAFVSAILGLGMVSLFMMASTSALALISRFMAAIAVAWRTSHCFTAACGAGSGGLALGAAAHARRAAALTATRSAIAKSASPSHTFWWTSGDSSSILRTFAMASLVPSSTTRGTSSSTVVVLVAVAAVLVLAAVAVVLVLAAVAEREALRRGSVGFSLSRPDQLHFSLLNLAMAESEMIATAIASRAASDVLLPFRRGLFMRMRDDHWAPGFIMVTAKL